MITQIDLQRLTIWRHRYTLRSLGFEPEQAQRLSFLRWLYLSGKVS